MSITCGPEAEDIAQDVFVPQSTAPYVLSNVTATVSRYMSFKDPDAIFALRPFDPVKHVTALFFALFLDVADRT